MSVELLISPPATGKTETCIQRIRSTFAQHPLAQVWIVVPDRLQAATFRRRLAASGGVLGGYVGTFRDLYRSILEQVGSYIPVVSSPLLHRLVQETVDQSVKEGELKHYAPIQRAPGFILALQDSFAELKRSLILPESFLEFTQNGTLAQQELALLYARYQSRLRELNWADQEGLSWLAVEALESNPAIAASIRLVVVDGFDSFTGARRRVLQLLAGQVDELLITFPGELDSTRSAHRRFTPVIETLRQEISPCLTTLVNLPYLPPDLLHLEKSIFETDSGNPRLATQPLLLEARSPGDEAREALRWIKMRVIRDKIALTDCAIFTPNPQTYQALLRASAAEFGIPVHFTQADALNESPAISALINLLTLPTQNFKTRLLINSLRSPYFDFSIVTQTIDDLENVSRVACIVEGRDQWDETWARLAPSGGMTYADIDEERSLPGLPHGAQADALRDSLANFFSRLIPPDGSLSQTEWIAWLEDLLEALRFYENASSDRDQLACEALREGLRALVLSETIVGLRRAGYAQFLADLQGALDGVDQPEPFLSGEPALLVGRMSEARGVRFKVVALLGLSEGIFPAVENPDPFLDENLRQALGLEARLQREQASLFYQAITRADQHLLITRPYLSDDGENWEASPFWKAAESLFSASALQKIRPDDPRALADAASTQEVLFWAVRRKGLPGRYAELRPRWDTLRHARDVLQARRAKVAQGMYEGSADAITPLLAERYSPAQVWSASRLESYGACPQMFYIGTALRLEAKGPPELGLDASQIGTILHKILEDVYRNAANPADPESVLALLPQVAKQVFGSAPQEYGFRPSALWKVEQAQFLAALELTITALAEEGQDWTPFAYEQTFGIEDSPPLVVDLAGESLRLHGVIDRLDRNSQGGIRVVDYKTGGSHLAQNDLKDGRRLQLPIYALAARDALGLGEPADGIYWKILAAAAGSLKLAKFKTEELQGPEAAYQVVREHLLRIITGIRAGNFSPAVPKGGCASYCPAAQWCWRFEPGW